MSKVAKAVATVAGVVAGVALIGTGIGAALGGTMILVGVGSASSIATIAGTVSALAAATAQATAKKPPVKGSANQITIGADQLTPYAMGRTAAQLAQVLDKGYGGSLSGVQNPYRTLVYVASTGPVGSIEAVQLDFATIAFDAGGVGLPAGEATGYYENFLWLDSQLGACPEASALTGPHGAIPGWSASHKLSGLAAVMLTAKFDKKGKKYASGVPQPGVILGEGVQVYDQRQDDTYPGGAGACRALDETTYVGGDAAHNPSCHAVTYALGRWQGSAGADGAPRKVMGCGIPPARIDWPAWTEFANVCDANGWKIGGSVFEPGSRWDNLKRICAAGGGVPVWTGGMLSVTFQRPRVALDTIYAADLADGELRIPGMRGWKDRINGIIPKYPSEANKWEQVQSDLVSNPDYVAEDRGEEKNKEVPYELVPYKDQAAQLAAYDLAGGRERSGIVLPLKPRLKEYRIGDALDIGADLAEETGLEAGTVLVITGRKPDPATMSFTFTFDTETAAKHTWALGRTGTAPPAPIVPTPGEMDDAAAGIVPDAPDAADWTAAGESLASPGGAIPAIVVTGGAPDTDGLTGIQFDYRTAPGAIALEGDTAGWLLWEDGARILLEDDPPGPWIAAMMDAPDVIEKEIVSVTPGTTYEVSVRYVNRAGASERLILGPVTVGVLLPAESISIGGTYDYAWLTALESRVAALE